MEHEPLFSWIKSGIYVAPDHQFKLSESDVDVASMLNRCVSLPHALYLNMPQMAVSKCA